MGVLHSPSSPETKRAPGTARPPVDCRRALSPSDLDQHYRIRRAVFVTEQGMFTGDDRDEHDDDVRTLHVLGFVGLVPGGTVRLYPTPSAEEPSLWKGDRLAVLPGFRTAGLGGPLVRHAVATAGAAGGSRMLAWVQLSNVRFFVHLGWEPVGGPESYVGQPHQQMRIGLQ